MHNTITRRAARIAIIAGLSVFLGACERSITSPESGRRIQAAQKSAHDDDPPTTPCKSGWVIESGFWVCRG
jgi:hypothetical protein